MRNATGRALSALAAAAFCVAAQPASAQQTNGCPAGQAMQSSDPSGKNITCVAIPNVSGLQGQISTETAARQAADTQLQGAIGAETAARAAAGTQLQNAINAEAGLRAAGNTQLQNAINAEATSRGGMDAMLLQGIQDETAERKAADDALRNAVIETSIVGSYTFTGPVICLNSSNGFNTDLTPKAATSPSASTIISQLTAVSYGTRTFNAGGTGTVDLTTNSILSPSIFYTSTNGVGIGFNGTAPNPSGSVSVVAQHADFTWEIVNGKLYITEDTVNGTFMQGTRAGWSVVNTGLPRGVGVLGKDLRTIALTNEDVQVETTTQTPGPGQTGTPSTTFRICARERILRKL